MTRRANGSNDHELPLSRTRGVDDDVRGELEFHLEQRAREFEARGMSPERAMAEARESFGDRAEVERACREIETRRRSTRHRADRLVALRQDVSVGLRVLRKSPGFTVAAIFMLALGIGANSAVFSIVNRVLLQPLPLPESNNLMVLHELHDNGGWGNIPWANFLDLQAQSKTLSAMASHSSGLMTVLGAGNAFRVTGGRVSSGFFKVFPVAPEMGRLLLPEEFTLGAPPVAVVSHSFWRDHLGSTASLADVHIKLDVDYSVVGVLPESFDFPAGNQIWIAMERNSQGMSRTSHNWDVIARLKPGMTQQGAERELTSILASLKNVYYPDFDATGAQVLSLQETLSGSFRTPLYLLLGASGLVLFGACVNLASAMLARGTARASEFSVRLALGATRERLIRQLITESSLLALAGCAVGLLVASGVLKALALFAPAALHLEGVRMDMTAQVFALITAALTTVLFGLLPALRLSNASQVVALRQGRSTAGAHRTQVWNVLVATEVALAVVLLSGSALLIKSFAHVMQLDLGFTPEHVTTVRVNLPDANYGANSATVAAFHERLLERLRNQPAIKAAGFTNVLPLGGGNPSGSLEVEGKPLDKRGKFNAYAVYRVGGGNFFEAMQIPLLKGRSFATGSATEAAPAVVVNEAFARSEWPNANPIGKRIRVAGMDGGTEPWYTVIGVVGNARSTSPTSKFENTYYFDHRDRPPYRTRDVSYVIRSTLDVAALAPLIRQEVAAIDKDVPLLIETMPERVNRVSAARRFPMLVLGGFALVSLLLAVVGIYAVVSYAVAQRTREIGVRLALGASPAGVRALVLKSAMRAIIPGLAVGIAFSIAAANFLRALLYGVSPFDPAALASAAALLGVAAMASSAIPAIRATRVDPLIAMRAE